MVSTPNELKTSPFRELLFEQEMEATEQMVLKEPTEYVRTNQHFKILTLHPDGSFGENGLNAIDRTVCAQVATGRVHHFLCIAC